MADALTMARDVLRMVAIGIQQHHITARDVEFLYDDGHKRVSVHQLAVEAMQGLEREIAARGVKAVDRTKPCPDFRVCADPFRCREAVRCLQLHAPAAGVQASAEASTLPPTSQEWVEGHRPQLAVTSEWRAGWDTCRDVCRKLIDAAGVSASDGETISPAPTADGAKDQP